MKLLKARIGIKALGAGLLFSVAASALATTMDRMSLDELVEQAEVGLIGEVTATESVYADGRFSTIVTVEADEVLFGQAGSAVRIRYPGGSAEINGVRVGESVPAAAPRLTGVKAAYFLGRSGADGVHEIVGFTQGQLDVIARNGQELIATPDQASLLELGDFAARIRALRDAQ